MKISRIEVYPVSLPREAFKASFGVIHVQNNVVIKVFVDEGLYGVGESSSSATFHGETVHSVIGAIETIAPTIIGKDPFNLGEIKDIMNRTIVSNRTAKAAIDMALHDIIGKKVGLPIFRLMGGAYKTEMPTHIAVGMREPEEMAKHVLGLVNQGFKVFELKAGLEPDKDIERVKKIREAVGGDVTLVTDANMALSVNTAINCLRKMEKYDVLAEQPCRRIDELAAVRKAVAVPIIADESCFTPLDAIEIVKKEAADMVNIKLMKAGGFDEALRIIAICESAGMSYKVEEGNISRIGVTATAHLAAISKGAMDPGLACFQLLSSKVDLVKAGGITLEKGIAKVPTGPGLGLEVNDEYIGKPAYVFPKSTPS